MCSLFVGHSAMLIACIEEHLQCRVLSADHILLQPALLLFSCDILHIFYVRLYFFVTEAAAIALGSLMFLANFYNNVIAMLPKKY